MDEDDWNHRLALLWASIDKKAEDVFLAEMSALVGERPADDSTGLFEQASAFDSTGRTNLAIESYRRALAGGLSGQGRRRATIQLASSLRALGHPNESVALLEAELGAESDDLDDAVRAFLALALADVGREREAVGLALTALAPHLKRYGRSLAAYAGKLASPGVK